MSDAFHQAVAEAVATKNDVAEAKALFTSDLAALRNEVQVGLAATKVDVAEVRHEIAMLRNELKLWMGSLAAALFAALSGVAAAMRFLGH